MFNAIFIALTFAFTVTAANQSATSNRQQSVQNSSKSGTGLALTIAGATLGQLCTNECDTAMPCARVREGLSTITTVLEETKEPPNTKNRWVIKTSRFVYRTLYTNKNGVVVGIQVTFENISDGEMKTVLKSLNEKYSRLRQTENDRYIFESGKKTKIESTVHTYLPEGEPRNTHTRYRVINFYYDEALLKSAMEESSSNGGAAAPANQDFI